MNARYNIFGVKAQCAIMFYVKHFIDNKLKDLQKADNRLRRLVVSSASLHFASFLSTRLRSSPASIARNTRGHARPREADYRIWRIAAAFYNLIVVARTKRNILSWRTVAAELD